MVEDKMKFVNSYEVDRRFGGQEEGGWYYNHYTLIESYPTREENTGAIVKFMEEEYEHRVHGNIYSVLGGLEVSILVEDKPGESQTLSRPRYE